MLHNTWHPRKVSFGTSVSTPRCLFHREIGLHRDAYRCATNIVRSVVAGRGARHLIKKMSRSGISDAEYSVERIYLHTPAEKNVSMALAFGVLDRDGSFRTLFQAPHRKDDRCTTLLERPDPYLAAHSLAFSVRLSRSSHDVFAVYSDLEEVDLTTKEVMRRVCLVGPKPLPAVLSVSSVPFQSATSIRTDRAPRNEESSDPNRSESMVESAHSTELPSNLRHSMEESRHNRRNRSIREAASAMTASDANPSARSSPESAFSSASPSRLPSVDSAGSSSSFSSDLFSDSAGSAPIIRSETASVDADNREVRRSRRRTRRPGDPSASSEGLEQEERAARARRQAQPQRNRIPVIKYIHHDLERNELLLTSIQTHEVICAVIVFRMWPLKFLLHFQVLKCDFPYVDSVSVGEGVVMLSSRARNKVTLYSLDTLLQKTEFEVDIGEELTVNGSRYVIGQTPHGLPINGRLTPEITPIASFASREGYMELGGTPYHTVTKEKGRPGYEVRSVATEKFVLASDCLSSVDLSPDAATFLDDGPFLVQYSVSELRVYDLLHRSMPLSMSAETFSDVRGRRDAAVTTRSGRRCRRSVPTPTDSDWRLSWNVEDELDALVVLIVEEVMEKAAILRKLLIYDRTTWNLTSETPMDERISLHGSGLSEVDIVLDRCLLFVKVRSMAGKCTALVYHVTTGQTETTGHVT